MKKLRAVLLAMAVYALVAVPASAAPRMIPVATHMGRGVTPSSLEIGPEGSAYVQGARLSREELVPEVYVYGAAGSLLRKFAIPPETAIEAFGNGQLYVGSEMAEHIYGVDPQTGAKISEVGAQNDGFPGNIGFPRGLAVGAGGAIYESGGEIGVPEAGNPDSIESIHPIVTFTAGGLYSGYIEPRFATSGGVGVLAASATGEVLGSWGTAQGIGALGVISPQGTALTQFTVFPPHPEVKGASFSADGRSLYAGVVLHHGTSGSTFIARLSLSGKVLERFGSIPIHDAANFWEYNAADVAADGAGWALRSVPGKLYRFHA